MLKYNENNHIFIAVFAIVAAVGSMMSFSFIHQANAAPGTPKIANGQAEFHSNPNAFNQGTLGASYHHTPVNQPCSIAC